MDGLIAALTSSDNVLGILAGVFLYLYVDEKRDHKKTREAHDTTRAERIADLKVSMESVHKSVHLLDGAIDEIRRGGRS